MMHRAARCGEDAIRPSLAGHAFYVSDMVAFSAEIGILCRKIHAYVGVNVPPVVRPPDFAKTLRTSADELRMQDIS
jgi:hypothetical protein